MEEKTADNKLEQMYDEIDKEPVLADGEKGPKEMEYEAEVKDADMTGDPSKLESMMQDNIDGFVGKYKSYAQTLGESTGDRASLSMPVGFNDNGKPVWGKIEYDPETKEFDIRDETNRTIGKTQLDSRFKDALNGSPQLLTECIDRNIPEQALARGAYEVGKEAKVAITIKGENGKDTKILFDKPMSSRKQQQYANRIAKTGVSEITAEPYKQKNPIQGTKLERLGNWCCRHPGLTISFVGAVAMGKGIGQLAMRVAMMGAQYVGDMSKQAAGAAVR